jgi:hypothetical protein
MKRFVAWCVLAGVVLAGCSKPATRAEFRKKELETFRCYCAGNIAAAESSLFEFEGYTKRCQQEGVAGILFNDVYARTYARLYQVEKGLGKPEAAERYLRQAAANYQSARAQAGLTNWPPRELRHLVEREFDRGLRVAWKSQ